MNGHFNAVAGLALATAAFVSMPIGPQTGAVKAQTRRRTPARVPLFSPRTEGRPLPQLVARGIDDAYDLVADLYDDDCEYLSPAVIKRDSDRALARLRSYREQAISLGRQDVVDAVNRALKALDDALDEYYEDCGPPSLGILRVGLDFEGFVQAERQSIGGRIGVGVAQLAEDPFFLKQKDTLTSYRFGGEFEFKTGDWKYSLSVSYSRGEETATASKGLGGFNVGYTPGDTAFGAGVFSGQATTANSRTTSGAINITTRALHEFNLRDGFAWGWGPRNAEEAEVSRKYLGLSATLDIREFEHDGQFFWTDFPNDLNIQINQDIRTTSLTVGPAISGMRRLGGGFYIGGYADLQGGIMYSRLDSVEDILCTACGGALPNVVDINDSKTDFAFRANLEGRVGYSLSRNFDINLFLGAQFGNRHILDVRQNPNDSSTAIASDALLDWYGGFRVKASF